MWNHLKTKIIRFCLKVVNEESSPDFIARGWSIGMFYGCSIPFGLQLLCSIPTALILKGSRTGAVLGTFITNHITILFIYPIQCYVGAKMLGMELTYSSIKESLKSIMASPSFGSFKELCLNGKDIAFAFLLGGFTLALIMTPCTYFFVRYIVIKFRMRKAKRIGLAN